MTFSKKTLSQCFFWFALIVGLFGVLTQLSGRIVFASQYFYLQLGILAMLASLAVRHNEK